MEDTNVPADLPQIEHLPGLKRLRFKHLGRNLEVRAIFDPIHNDWLVAVKDGAQFVVPSESVLIGNMLRYDAMVQGGVFGDIISYVMYTSRDAVINDRVRLLPLDEAPDQLRR